MKNRTSIIVIGALNTDIIATGINKFPKAGEYVYIKELKIGPGGKSRNIAQMIATLTSPGTIAMIGKTSMDPYNFWKVPLKALKQAKVNIDFVTIVKSDKLPGIAIIPVDEKGNNQIFVYPGITDDFSEKDIDQASALFATVKDNKGYFVTTLELPFWTAVAAMKKAADSGLKIIFDPGGIAAEMDANQLFGNKIFLIKPNEHEAQILTGIKIQTFQSAKKAASKLLDKGIENILITVGKNGAYFFNADNALHIKPPHINTSDVKDETGCGDQTIATITAFLSEGKSLLEAIHLGIIAGTLQFQHQGIKPVTKEEIVKHWKNNSNLSFNRNMVKV